MKRNVWNFNISLFAKSCTRHNAKPFNFFTFGFYSFLWIFGYILHDHSYFIPSMACIFFYLMNFPAVIMINQSINQWKLWLSSGLIKNESLINQRTHKITKEEIAQVCVGFQKWVETYEKCVTISSESSYETDVTHL